MAIGIGQDRESANSARPRGSLVAAAQGGRLASWIIGFHFDDFELFLYVI